MKIKFEHCHKGFIFLLAFVTFLSSCTFNRKLNFEYSELQKKDSLEIKLPLDYIALSKWQTFKNSDQTFLLEYGFNRDQDLLIFKIDLKKGDYLDPLKISNEGPNGFNSSDLFISYQGSDSIYVFPVTKNKFSLYNSSGEKLLEFPYNNTERTRFYTSGVYSDISKYDNGLILPTINDTRFDDPNYFEKVIPVSYYDFELKQFDKEIPYPDYFEGKYFPSNVTAAQVSFMKDDISIINYSFSDSIYLYNSLENKLQGVYCGIPTETTFQYFTQVPDRTMSLDYITKEKNYEFVQFHNGKIYRIVSHLKSEKFRNLSIYQIISENLRGVTLIELDPSSKTLKYYEMPIARYFVFQENELIVGGVSMWEDENQDTFMKYYIYNLE